MNNTDKTPVTIFNAVNSITASTAPVLFLDTCAILDVIRTPQRDIQEQVISAANNLLEASTKQKTLWIVATTMVENEFNEKLQKVENEVIKHVEKVDKDLEKLRKVANYMFGYSKIQPLSFRGMKIAQTLRKIAEYLLDSAILIDSEDDCILRAAKRVANKKRPSQTGNQQYKDCEIIEHYLEIARQLRHRGFQEKCVFVSSNTKDFCEEGKTKIHPDLDTDFQEVGMEYAKEIAWAKSLIFPKPTLTKE